MPARPARPAPPVRPPAGAEHLDLPEVLQFMRALWALTHGLERASKRMSVEIGVTGPQRLVLRVVGLFPGLSAGDLARVLHVHPSTLTGVLQRLVTQRLVTRVADPRDRRRALLHLSPRGLTANAVTRGTVEAVVGDAIAALNGRDLSVARRVLTELARHLDGSSGPAGALPPKQSPGRRPAVRGRQ